MVVKPAQYHWLKVGQRYRYQPALGKGRDDLRGQDCLVLAVPQVGSKPANVLVEFAGGERHVVPHGVLRGNKTGGF